MIGKEDCGLGRGDMVSVKNGDIPVEEVMEIREDDLDDWIEAEHWEINDFRRIYNKI